MPRSKDRRPRKPAGQLGGRSRANRLTPKQRSQSAQLAAKTRWGGPQPDPEFPGKVDATLNEVIDYYENLPGFIENTRGTPLITAIMTAHSEAILERHPNDPEAVKAAEHVRDIFLVSTEGRMMASMMAIEAGILTKTVTLWKRTNGSNARIPIDHEEADRGPGWYYDSSEAMESDSPFFVAFPRGPYETKDTATEAATNEFGAQGYRVKFISGEPQVYDRIKLAISDYDPYGVTKKDQILLVPYLRAGYIFTSEEGKSRRKGASLPADRSAGSGFVMAIEPLTMHQSGRLFDWASPGVLDTMTSHPVDFDVVERMFGAEETDELKSAIKPGRPKRSERQRISTPVRFENHPNGTRSIELTPEMKSLIEVQLRCFKEKFGRAPEGNEPIFFDPDADTPQPYREEKFHKVMMEVLGAAGCPPAMMYAYEKCGFMVTTQNWQMWDEDDLAEWEAALNEYHDKI